MSSSSRFAEYALGHSESEMRRLILQAAALRPMTERLLRAAGLAPGMRVLDLGCGPGDVSLLAAELVGRSGAVLGVDRSEEALVTARARAKEMGLAQIRFLHAAADEAVDTVMADKRFDAVIGRFVLCYLPDPIDTLRRAVARLAPGGILAFHEVDFLDEFRSRPLVPLWQQAGQWLLESFRPTIAHPDIAGRLVEAFETAGLPMSGLFCECPVGGGTASPLYAWLAERVRSVLPLLPQSGAATCEEVGIDSLEVRLQQAVVAMSSQVAAPAQVCAWARKSCGEDSRLAR
ncbi:class I SAM-dependent methyltransferase [Rhizobium calliandrae]|uniref:Class I SAM-dependent methyltransferase n=1 Tax=Rhizobium calliandrae TaxID=1312182 RepID=A0ABT7KGC2_9HYPH|nr:class I SAM-dependent methyltransferase [Rhizobium calliandrae]MDL2407602.1 class I SAM-dependent methyltransferase [Rhizobium calliandrae]